MRYGINLVNWVPAWQPDTLPLVAHVAQLGFTALELPMTQPNIENQHEWRRETERWGLGVTLCASLTKGRDLSNFDATVRADTLHYLRGCLETGAELGASVLCGPLYTGGGKCHRLPPEEKQREWALAVEGLQVLAETAQRCGVKLAIEPLHRYRTSVVNKTSQALAMVADVAHPFVGLHFDTYHANIEEESVTGALQAAVTSGRLYHVHACANNRGAPGMGHLPWAEVAALLKAGGYDADVTMETFCDDAALDDCWYPLAQSPDALAISGLENMRTLFA